MELSNTELEKLRYPIGKMPDLTSCTDEYTKQSILQLSEFPLALMKIISEIKKEGLIFSYRPGGWNIAQMVHHLADSHLNAYVRIKLALSEENPTIKPYDENKWAAMPDATSTEDTHVSVLLVSAIHHRLAVLLSSLSDADFKRTVFHPELQKTISIADFCNMYAWHGNHHLAQIKIALEKRY